MNKRQFQTFEFMLHSTSEPGSGLLEVCPDRELRGLLSLPLSGVQALLALLIGGHSVVLEIHASAFKRGTALVRTNSSWSTEGHPSLEAESS